MNTKEFQEVAKRKSRENQRFLKGLRNVNPKKLDEAFHDQHEQVFEEIDCLTCANCCKTTSPIFYSNDIERAAKAIGVKPGDFVERFLRIDEDKDYVLKEAPCPFLSSDNYCSIYDDRPKACREYPHTNRKKMTQILDLTYRNTLVCPAVLTIVERMKALKL